MNIGRRIQRVMGFASAALLAGPAAALTLKPAGSNLPWAEGLKAIAIAAVALAIAYAGLRRLRQRDTVAAPGQRGPRVIESRRASQKTLLLVVQWEGKRYFLAETGSALQLLDSAAGEEPAP